MNEGAYRLVRKGSVASEAIASGGYARTVREVSGSEEVLAAEDTTTLSWSDVGSRERRVEQETIEQAAHRRIE